LLCEPLARVLAGFPTGFEALVNEFLRERVTKVSSQLWSRRVARDLDNAICAGRAGPHATSRGAECLVPPHLIGRWIDLKGLAPHPESVRRLKILRRRCFELFLDAVDQGITLQQSDLRLDIGVEISV